MNDLLKILAAPLIGAIIQWVTLARSKARLKTDLELLELYKKADPDSENYKEFKEEVDKRVKYVYRIEKPPRTDMDWSDFSWGAIFLLAAMAIAFDWIPEQDLLKVSVASGLAIGAAFAFRKAFERKFRK